MKKRIITFIGLLLYVSFIFSADWSMISKITADDRTYDDYFPSDVAISGNYAIVGVYHESQSVDEGGFISEAGAAYIFRFDGSGWVQMQKLTAPVRIAEDHFGYSVDICGNYAIVGAPWKDDTDTDYGEGVAFIYYFDGSSWVLQDKLFSDDRLVGDHFGYSVAMTDDRAVIGAPYKDLIVSPSDTILQAGTAYVFSRSGTNWTQTGQVAASDAGYDDRMGIRVAIDGSYIVASTPYEDHDADSLNYEVSAGAAYVYYHGATGWQEQAKLVASDRDMSDYFGYSIDIEGSHIVVGAYMEDHDADGANKVEKAGSAYIFTHGTGGWSETQKIVASERWASDFFGCAVSIDDNLLIVGARGEDHDTLAANYIPGAGAAYIFRNNGGVWLEQEKITESYRREDDAFGTDVAISGDVAIIGAPGNDLDSDELNLKNGAGAAFIFSSGIGGISEPEIMVTGNDLEIVSGDSSPSLADHTNFDTTQVSTGTLIREFTIHNTGSGYLMIDSVYTDGIADDDFTFLTYPPDSISAGSDASFSLSFTPSSVGRRNTTVYIENNDADEDPYTFIIQGAGKTPYSGGSGTEENPFLISTFADLLELSEMSHDWDKYFLQTHDIDASGSDSLDIGDYDGDPGTPDEPMGFSPIGDSPTEGDRQLVAFSGSYDGGHHVISDLYIYRPYEKMVGLFGYVKDVSHTHNTAIKNIRLDDVFIYGGTYIGGLVGWNIDAVIDSCEVSGDINTINGTGGGLVGFNQDKISHCHTRCYVSTITAGGLVGYDEFGEIVDCSASDTVFSIGGSAGGLVGSAYQSKIPRSFSKWYVLGFNNAGGLAGRITYKTNIQNCYALGEVNGQPANMFSATGGFCGLVDGYGINLGSTIENCYALTDVVILSGDTTSDKGFVGTATQTNTFENNFFCIDPDGHLSDAAGAATPKDSTAMRDIATYTDIATEGLTSAWDLAHNYYDDAENDDLWDMDTSGVLNEGFPFLFWQNGDAVTLPEPEVAIADIGLPDKCALLPAYPNPFNPRTAICYQLSANSYIELNVYNVRGKLADRLIDGYAEAGKYELIWDASDMPSGVYIVRMVAEDFIASQKMVLLK